MNSALNRSLLTLGVMAWLALPVGAAETDRAELLAEHRQLAAQLRSTTGGWQPAPPASGSLLFVAPDQYSPAREAEGGTKEAREEYARALWKLACRAAESNQPSLAFEWATEALRNGPNHAAARRILGYEERNGEWLTTYGAKMFDDGKVWDAGQGWVARDDQTTSAGASPPSSASDAARHADIKRGWQIRTDHFLVTTNHSLGAGAELAARLERLYQLWRQLFAGFNYTASEVRDLFAGERVARVQQRPFRVFYYRDRDQYAAALRRRQPRIAETLGIYFDTHREAHFFASAAGDGRTPVATLYHEAVHQLFQESKPSARKIGSTANFWAIEGVATYFETLTEHDDPRAGMFFTLGEASSGRLPAARERLRDGFSVPLAELAAMNQDEVQRHPEIAKLYSQAAGVAGFLMDADGGRFREPFVRYLQRIYAGRDDQDSLATSAETSYPELDKAYRTYLQSLP